MRIQMFCKLSKLCYFCTRFHSIWMRNNCHCSECKQDHSGQKLINVGKIKFNTTVRKASDTGTVYSKLQRHQWNIYYKNEFGPNNSPF